MTGAEIFFNLLISYTAGSIPQLSKLILQEKEIADILNITYQKALEKWAKNESIRETESHRMYQYLPELLRYLQDSSCLSENIKELIAIWLGLLRSDTISYDFILESKLDLIRSEMQKSSEITLNHIEAKIDSITSSNNKIGKDRADIVNGLHRSSVDLSSYDNRVQGRVHIPRSETLELYDWVTEVSMEDKSRVAILTGNAGYGKSVVLRDLYDHLTAKSIPCLGIKADKILNINSIKDIEAELTLDDTVVSIFETLTKDSLCVLIIDQIDALSLSLSSNRQAINIYERLIKQLERLQNMKIIISCRTYDLEYDVNLRAFRNNDKNKIVKLSSLKSEEVDAVLSDFDIQVDKRNNRLIEFLQIPLHLNLFCKLKHSDSFSDNISLQKLYDEVWSQFIDNGDFVSHERIVEILTLIAGKMNEQQQIVIDKRLFNSYSKEINYLIGNGFVIESSINKIQFMHQTFFDYIYSRTFINSGKSVTIWLKEVHQGLFIRSQVKQIFAYLRDIDHVAYINELKEILGGDEYRFHLKLLLINDLGYYDNPTAQEKRVVSDYLLRNPLFFQVFVESIQSTEWFEFILSKDEFNALVKSEDSDIEWVIVGLCCRIIEKSSEMVIDFLHDNCLKSKIVMNTLMHISDAKVELSYNLYHESVSDWESHYKYGYLKKVLSSDPDFVINELYRDNIEQLNETDSLNDSILSWDYNRTQIHEKLFEKYFDKAIPYFLNLIEAAISKNPHDTVFGLIGDFSFYCFRPKAEKCVIDDINSVYDIVLFSIKYNLLNSELNVQMQALLNSSYANLLAIGVFYLVQNIEDEKEKAYSLCLSDNFWIKVNCSEILRFYSYELLSKLYPLLSNEEQAEINNSIKSTTINYCKWVIKSDYTSKKVCSTYLKEPYKLISMIPDDHLNLHKDIKRIKQEGYRKYGSYENTAPEEVQVTIGDRSYTQGAYEKMTLKNWKESFLKLCSDDRSIESFYRPNIRGNRERFKDHIAKDPEIFYDFIVELVQDQRINIGYILSGLEGLKTGDYDKLKVEILCSRIIDQRKSEVIDGDLISFLRSLEYVVYQNCNLNISIFNFIKWVVYNSQDRELPPNRSQVEIGQEVIYVGINSVRGVAVGLITSCYKLKQYENEIFEILEFVAENANEVTRSSAIYGSAVLINLNKERAYCLYLKLMYDLKPALISIPAYNGHPLWHLMHIDFENLIPFFEKGIEIESAAKSMALFLFNAYLYDLPKSEVLLIKLLNMNSDARKELAVKMPLKVFESDKLAVKAWKLMTLLSNYDDEKLGDEMNQCFYHFPEKLNEDLAVFLSNYVKSPIGKKRDQRFYNFIRKLITDDPSFILKCFFDSNPTEFIKDFYDESPINVLIEAYNAIREYEKNNPILEEAMNMFDSLLKIQKYRNNHLWMFFKELTA